MTLRKKLFWVKDKGQVAIVAVLIVAVLVLVALSLASRTTQEVSLATQTRESSVALSAAESGAEKAISQVITALENGEAVPESGEVKTLNVESDDGTTVSVEYSVSALHRLEMKVTKGNQVMIDLRSPTTHQPVYTGNLEVKWAKEADCTDRAGLIITTYYLDGDKIRSRYQAVGSSPSCSAKCASRTDKFVKAKDVSDDSGYKHSFTLSGLTTNDLFVTFQPIYADTDLKVTGGDSLPVQQYTIISRGTGDAGESDETRAVRIDYALPVASNLQSYAVYSGDTLVK